MEDANEVYALETAGGVTAIDSGLMRHRMAACYLVEEDDGVAFIESGTNASVPRMLRMLSLRGWGPEDVRYVIVTHVHLDHAGGAGRLMRALPDAEFLVHPRGARHMIDPARLEASVRGVYGDAEFDRMYGALVPIQPDRVREISDGDQVALGERRLEFMDTPGHARHHFCVWDGRTRGWFAGDTFGLSYRELDTDRGAFIFPTTTPVQFDPAALRNSIAALMDRNPKCIYLTHFGRVTECERLAEDLLDGVDALAEMATRRREDEQRTEAIRRDMLDWLLERARAHGVALPDTDLREILTPDVVLNTQGLEHWLDYG